MPTSAALVAVIPHPDDEAYSMAGTLHVAAAAGATVTVVCATRGERGEDFSPVATTQLGARRSAELAASCAAMGVQARWLDLPDGGLASLPPGRLEAALCEALAALAALAPQAVLSLGPDGAPGPLGSDLGANVGAAPAALRSATPPRGVPPPASSSRNGAG